MGFRLGLILLLLAMAMVAESSFSPHFELDSLRSRGGGTAACNGRVGDCGIEEDQEMMMDSEASRRVLAGQRFISYGALRANNVPCNRRGRSYYNCNQRGRANPYRRGCSHITRCARYT